jgi:oxazoline/thiazoline synthase
MIKRPVFKSHIQVSVIPGEGVLLLSDDTAKALYGRVYEVLAPLIDGSKDTDEIVDALAGKEDIAAVYYALMLLEEKGHIAESRPDVAQETAAFWHVLGIDPAAAIGAINTSRVRVIAVGKADAAPMRIALAEAGIPVADGEAADLEVVVADDYLRADLETRNAAMLAQGRPWLLLKPGSHEPWIGPLYVPGKTGCHHCLSLRLLRNRPFHRFVAEKRNLDEFPITSTAASPAAISAACRLAALEAAKYLAGVKEGLQGKVLSLDVRSWSAAIHELLRHPACPACGEAETAEARPVELIKRKITHVKDCGHRAVASEQTLKTYEHLVSPITGVVKMLTPVQYSDSMIHVYFAGRNPALNIRAINFLRRGIRTFNAGKGISETQAKVSALCEAIERYSGEYTGSEVTVTASYREMQDRFGADTIHPNEVMRYSDRQYTERDAWNARQSKFNLVPERLDEEAAINWTPVWSLTKGRHGYLPTQLIYFGAKTGPDCDSLYSMGCSNGNASGNNLEEAVLQGLCELVERDATAIWWYNRLRKPRVAVETFGEPYLIDLINHYRDLGRDAWALDITTDLGIPAFAAVSRLVDGPEERIFFGLGCHPDAMIALQRAFAEMNQMLGTVQCKVDPAIEDTPIEDREAVSWFRTATLANQPYMAPDETAVPRRLEDYPTLHSDDLLEHIRQCRRIVEEQGMEVLVLDQTRSDVRMPVVKVIVPGLRHFWARFAPGRLYDVPVKMGWLDKALTEEELNPIPVFV